MNKSKLFILSILIILCSCSSSQEKSKDYAISTEERKVISYITSLVPPTGVTIEHNEIFTQELPILFSKEMQTATNWAMRNKFNPEQEQANIDKFKFKSVKQKATELLSNRYKIIDSIQNEIKDIYDKSLKRNSDRKFIIVLQTTLLDDGFSQKREKDIFVSSIPFDEKNAKQCIKVYGVRNNLIQDAQAIVNALNGTLLEYETNENQNLDSLSKLTDDRVLKFILNSN